MKLEWIEDLLVLAQAGSFSRAAALRNISQPAFSRRIQMLENWLQAELIDRTGNTIELTPVAQRHLDDFRTLLTGLNQLRSRMQTRSHDAHRIVLATQHSLTMTQLPRLLELLANDESPRINLIVRSENRDECVGLFMHGQADLLLCMEEHNARLNTFLPYAKRMPMGTETLVPVSAVGSNGKALHALGKNKALPMLAFPRDTFLGRLLYRQCLDNLMQHYPINVVHESVFLAGIKEMVLAGLGVGWLPARLAQREIANGSLTVLGRGLKSIKVELGLYHHAEPAQPQAIKHLWNLLSPHPTTPD